MDTAVVSQVLQTLPSVTPKVSEARTEVTQFLTNGFASQPSTFPTAPSTNNAMPPIPQLPQMRMFCSLTILILLASGMDPALAGKLLMNPQIMQALQNPTTMAKVR